MPQVCFYFQLHQPYRLRDLTIFDIGEDPNYFASKKDNNKKIFQKVAKKSYLPMLTLLLRLIKEVPQFTFSLSCSGIFLEQAQEYEPEVITLLQKLAKTNRVEFLAETYYHSLASLYSEEEFAAQIQLHKNLIQDLFGLTPRVFRNTELIYSNDIAKQVAKFGFQGMLTEAVDRYLHGRPKTRVYRSVGDESLPLLLKHAEFSDDIAFRFSDKNWPEYPLTVEKYLGWLSGYYDEEVINLFMDFETFGEHQWEDTGIFDFFEKFIHEFSRLPHNAFVTPTEAIKWAVGSRQQEIEKNQSFIEKLLKVFITKKEKMNSATFSSIDLPIYDVPTPISWADVDRDLTAWTENSLQQDTLLQIYGLQKSNFKDSEKLDIWRKLQTSDHFYYMCTKWAADGDVHAYFSPYESPYDAYRNYCIALGDITSKISLR